MKAFKCLAERPPSPVLSLECKMHSDSRHCISVPNGRLFSHRHSALVTITRKPSWFPRTAQTSALVLFCLQRKLLRRTKKSRNT